MVAVVCCLFDSAIDVLTIAYQLFDLRREQSLREVKVLRSKAARAPLLLERIFMLNNTNGSGAVVKWDVPTPSTPICFSMTSVLTNRSER